MGTKTPEARYTLVEGNEPPLTEDDIIVLVMGATGTGKSTLISKVTGKETIAIGHKLGPGTAVIQLHSCNLPNTNRRCVLVDTVGFDDNKRSDAEVLGTIADWLAATYDKKIVPTGLLILHSITDNRFSSVTTKNLDIFRRLCGDDYLKNVVLVTTMWGNLDDPDKGLEREAQLTSGALYWQPLIRRGAQVCRFQNTQESGFEILNILVNKERKPFQIQREMVEQRFTLARTSAGKLVDTGIKAMSKTHEHALSSLKGERQRKIKDKDELGREFTEDETRVRREELEKAEKWRKLLKRNFWRGIGDAILRAFGFHISVQPPAD